MTARWRLLLLAEMGVGWQVREKGAVEQKAVAGLKRQLGATNGRR